MTIERAIQIAKKAEKDHGSCWKCDKPAEEHKDGIYCAPSREEVRKLLVKGMKTWEATRNETAGMLYIPESMWKRRYR